MELKARKPALFAKVIDGDGGMGTPIGAADPGPRGHAVLDQPRRRAAHRAPRRR